MIRIAISGIYGKTGEKVAEEAEKNDKFEIAFGVDRLALPGDFITTDKNSERKTRVYNSFLQAEKEGESCDGIIDFSSTSALKDISEFSERTGAFVLFATTNYSEEDKSDIKKLSHFSAICRTENTSRGISAIKEILPSLYSALSDYEISITEIHNKNKKDAPSGTAKALNELLDEKANVSSVREGDAAGIHTVVFRSENEEIVIRHEAFSRKLFADGALKIAEILYKKSPGLYNSAGKKI